LGSELIAGTRALIRYAPGESNGEPNHMGVLIEISDNTPGVMVAADGTEVALRTS
jgi:hypothetical protein